MDGGAAPCVFASGAAHARVPLLWPREGPRNTMPPEVVLTCPRKLGRPFRTADSEPRECAELPPYHIGLHALGYDQKYNVTCIIVRKNQ